MLYAIGRQTAALKIKICGLRAPFNPKIYISKTVKMKNFVIKTLSWALNLINTVY